MDSPKIHHLDKISALADEIAVNDLFVIIAYFRGEITKDQAILACRSYKELFERNVNKAAKIGVMLYENEKTISDLLDKAT